MLRLAYEKSTQAFSCGEGTTDVFSYVCRVRAVTLMLQKMYDPRTDSYREAAQLEEKTAESLKR